jgi:hypothetical protein
MTRRLLNLLTVLSLLVCMAVVGLVCAGVLHVRFRRLLPAVDEYIFMHRPSPPPAFVEYTIPGWMLILSVAIPLAVALRVAYRRRQPAAGHCRHCGYDLRATPERCPECGQVA